MEEKQGALKSTAYAFIIIIGIAVIFSILKLLAEIFIPFVIAYFLFFVFSPLNNYLEKYKIPTWATILIDIAAVLLIFASISSLVIDSFSEFQQFLPEYERKLNSIIISTATSMGIKDPELTKFSIAELLAKIDYKLLAGNVFTSTFSALGSLLFVLFFFVFVVTGHNNIYLAVRKRYLSNKNESKGHPDGSEREKKKSESRDDMKVQKTFKDITNQVQRYIVTKFLISLSTGIIEGTVIWIFGVDFVIVWAVLIFLLNFIPNIGSLIGLSLPCIMLLIQTGSVPAALTLAAVLIVIDTIIGNIIEPKIFGDRLGLNPLIILFSLLLWGYIWGVTGALLSVPLTAVLKIIISRSDNPNMVFINDLMSSGPKA